METVVKNRVAFMISMTIIFVAAAFLVIAGYLAFVPVNVVTARTQPYAIATPTVTAGDSVIYIADVCKHKESLAVASRTFVDEQGTHYPIPQLLSSIKTGCNKNRVVVPTLPSYHTGKWYLTLDIEYQVNPLRHETYHFRTDTFTIVNKTVTQGVQ